MSMRSTSNYSANPTPSGGGAPAVMLIIAGVVIWYGVIPALSLMLGVVSALADSSVWAVGAKELAGQLVWGLVLGCVLGLIRFTLRRRKRTLTALAESFGTPEAVNAAQIGVAALVLHIAICMAIAAFVAMLGMHSPFLLGGDTHSIFVAGGALSQAIIAAGGSGGGEPGILVTLVALALLIIVAGVLLGALVGGTLGIIAFQGLSGAVFAGGQAFGASMTLVLTEFFRGGDLGHDWNCESVRAIPLIKRAVATGATTGALTGSPIMSPGCYSAPPCLVLHPRGDGHCSVKIVESDGPNRGLNEDWNQSMSSLLARPVQDRGAFVRSKSIQYRKGG